MNDPILVEAREKIFEEYRQISTEMSKIKDEITNTKEKMNSSQKIYNDLSRKHMYLNQLIDIMIKNDCDPVEAKLKYNEQLTQLTGSTDIIEISENKYPSISTGVYGRHSYLKRGVNRRLI